MKLGEALRLRSDNFKKMDELRGRAVSSTQAQEGDPLPELPDALLAEIERFSAQTLDLVQRINRTNVVTRLADGKTLADAIAERDACLKLRLPFDAVAQAASATQQRFLRSEIKVVRTVDPTTLRKKADALAQRHRLLDATIQELNWTTDLID